MKIITLVKKKGNLKLAEKGSSNCTGANRNLIFDAFKIFAVILIYSGHFATHHSCNWFSTWVGTYGLYGFTGKLGVAIFAVSLGFFAFRHGDISSYIIHRYLYFFYGLLFVNLLVTSCNTTSINRYELWCCFKSAVRINEDIWPAAWCMNDFLIGSVLCFLNGKADATPLSIGLQIIGALLFHQIWIAICLMGALVHILSYENHREIHTIVKIIIYILCFLAIQRPESSITYVFDGFAVAIVIFILQNDYNTKQKWENISYTPLIATLGKNCMGFYLIHTVILSSLGEFLFLFIDKDKMINQLAVMIIVFCVIWICAIPINKILLQLTNFTEIIIMYIGNKLKTLKLN